MRLKRKLKRSWLYTVKTLSHGLGYAIYYMFGNGSPLMVASITKDDKITFETTQEEIEQVAEQEFDELVKKDNIALVEPRRSKEKI